MVDRKRLEPFVRHFPENGLKVLLEMPGNVHDVMQILQVRALPRIDFGRMTVDRTHYVQRDYRHIESDVVLKAPLRVGRQGKHLWVTIYILIEHQSEPDPFMALRVLEYVVLIYREQLRAASKEGRPPDDFRLQPVLPIVLYSGTRTWDKLGKVADLVEFDKDLADRTPSFEPLFLNLGRTSTEALAARGGPFGLLLRLIQQRKTRLKVFEETLAQVGGTSRKSWRSATGTAGWPWFLTSSPWFCTSASRRSVKRSCRGFRTRSGMTFTVRRYLTWPRRSRKCLEKRARSKRPSAPASRCYSTCSERGSKEFLPASSNGSKARKAWTNSVCGFGNLRTPTSCRTCPSRPQSEREPHSFIS
jgi:hypothetical protein